MAGNTRKISENKLKYSEYKKLSFTDKPVSYIIGSKKGTPFISLSTLFFSSEECEIRFNNDNKETDWEVFHKEVYYERYRKIFKVTVRRHGNMDGILEIWAEGKLAR